MKFNLQLPTDRVKFREQFGTAEAVMEMSNAAETHGYDAVFVTEHPIPQDEWMRTGGHHALDPFVALSFAAAGTRTLRLQTNLCVIPYRNPFITAKAVATLDSLSGGRFVLGAGAGYLEPEFHALGVAFERRNELFDEALVAMKQVWTGESIDFDGEGFEVRGHHALPTPVQSPHPPIWIGGNSRRAIRRSVDHADGWMPIPNPAKLAKRRGTPALENLDDLRKSLDYMREYADERGRAVPRDLVFMSLSGGMYGTAKFDAEAKLDEIAEMREIGVTHVAVSFPVDTRAEFLHHAGAFADEVVSRSREP
ncbi:MAG: LLM class F420-dependent oxidoreductase [Myxococcales bacterium]|nr:LLM class F420-dependent oxidoreductase [Myxococcales bacterium]